jgi:O-antigen/teichoic acid export membrane protein
MSTPTTRTIFKNFGFLLTSQVVTWGWTLLLTICVSRYLGAAALGKLHLAESLWAIMAMLMNFGMNTLLVKEVARTPARTPELFTTTLRVSSFFGVLSFALLALYVHVTGYSSETVHVVYLIGIAGFIGQLGETCRATLQGLERMEYIALASIASKAFTSVASVGLLLMGQGVVLIAAVTIVSALMYLLTQLVPLHRLHQLRLCGHERPVASLIRSSVPYFAIALLLASYQQMNTIIISLLVDEAAVGWYGAANKLFGTFLFIPVLFVTASFATVSRMHTDASELLPLWMRKSFHLLLVVGVPIGLGMIVIADSVVLLLFGNGFAKSGPVLAVMGLAMIFTYQNILMANFLISTDRQFGLTLLISLAILATIVLDIMLVPWCQRTFDNGAIGGALANLITEAGMFIGCLRLLPKGTFGWTQTRIYGQVLLVGVIMVVTAWWLRHLFVAIPIVFSAVIYGGLLVALRLLPQEDWDVVKNLGKDALTRLGMRKPAADWRA